MRRPLVLIVGISLSWLLGCPGPPPGSDDSGTRGTGGGEGGGAGGGTGGGSEGDGGSDAGDYDGGTDAGAYDGGSTDSGTGTPSDAGDWPGYDAGPPRLDFVCSPTKWCFSYPHPHGLPINSLVQDGRGGVFAVSPAAIDFLEGTFVRSEGLDWGWAPAPSNSEVQEAVCVDREGLSGQLWGYGNGNIHRWNGQSWTRAANMPRYGTDMIGFDERNAFIVGDDGMIGQLGAAPDGGFAFKLTDAGLLNAVWGFTPQDVWIGGGVVRHYDGVAWSDNVTTPTGAGSVHSIAGSASNDVWMGGGSGAQGFLWRWDGGSLAPVATTVGVVRDLAAESATRAWAITNYGRIYLWDGQSWTLTKDARESLTTLLRRWNGELWVAGSRGLVMSTKDGVNWQGQGANEAMLLFNVSADERYAAGNAGSIFRWTSDAGWKLQARLQYADGGAASVAGGWAASSNDVWIGAVGSVFRYDGTGWSEQPMPAGMTARRISGTSSTDVWVSNGGGLARWNGSGWASFPALSFNSVTSVQAFSPTAAVAGTGNTGIYRWDGTAWTQAGASIVNALWGNSASEVWAVGTYGAIYFYDGGTTTQIRATDFSAPSLNAVGGSSATDVWAGGYNMLLHWDGGTWTPTTSHRFFDHSWIVPASPTDVMTSTWRSNQVLRYRP